MGSRGPAKTPTRLRLLRGETRPSQVNRNEPTPRDADPPVPRDLPEAARKVWRRVMRDQAPGVIRAIDRDGLRIYCEAVVRYEQSARLLAETGPLVRGLHGNMVRNPLHQVARDNADMVLAWARQLGLTPSARAGLEAPAAGGDGLEEFFG